MTTPPLICIVDDTADYRLIVGQLFGRYFSAYSVAFFADGKDFLEELAQLSQLPSLILLDRHMPGLDGHQTLLILKEHPVYKAIPVVMMSTGSSAGEIKGCYEAGANSFLSKLLDFDSMKNQMQVVCQYWLEMNQNRVKVA